ncbi:unnamed protein product, partial [Mesorhabditis spiculigera]
MGPENQNDSMNSATLPSVGLLVLVAVCSVQAKMEPCVTEKSTCYENITTRHFPRERSRWADNLCRHIPNFQAYHCLCSKKFVDDYKQNNCGNNVGFLQTRMTCGEFRPSDQCPQKYERSRKTCWDLAQYSECLYAEQAEMCQNTRAYKIYFYNEMLLELNTRETVRCRKERIEFVEHVRDQLVG